MATLTGHPDIWHSDPSTLFIIVPVCGSHHSYHSHASFSSLSSSQTAWDSHHEMLCPESQEDRGALGRLELYCREAVPERMRGVALAPMLVLRAAAIVLRDRAKRCGVAH